MLAALLAAAATFVYPTSVDVARDGTVLVVENGMQRVDRLDPRTNRVAVVVSGLAKPYALRDGVLSDGHTLRRLHGGVLAHLGSDIGPIAVAANGDVWFTTETALYQLQHGTRTPKRVPGVRVSGPHGIALEGDGSVLVSDTGNHRLLRVARGRASVIARIANPRGVDVGRDGSIYVVDADAKRVVHLRANGARIGAVGPRFGDPYDLEVATDGAVWVVDTGTAGTIHRFVPG